MKLTIEQSLDNNEVEITIKCGLIDSNLEKLISQIRLYCFSLVGKKDGKSFNIKFEDSYYFESIENKTFIYMESDIYECDLKLYEIEKLLEHTSFIRISKSCILNIDQLDSVRVLINGKFEAKLNNGEKLVINRHYVKKFKEKFGI